jgi:hypothetical protein
VWQRGVVADTVCAPAVVKYVTDRLATAATIAAASSQRAALEF